MSDQIATVTTRIERENNPKAVFFGDQEKIITSLALYLSARSVDLFSAKTLEDAAFGDYFFFVGQEELVKHFIETHAATFPKTLLLLDFVSDMQSWRRLGGLYPKIKLVTLGGLAALTSSQVNEIMNFFLGSDQLFLHLTSSPLRPKEQAAAAKVETEVVTHRPVSQHFSFSEKHSAPPQFKRTIVSAEKTDQVTEKADTRVKMRLAIPETQANTKTSPELREAITNLYRNDPKLTRQEGLKRKLKTTFLSAALAVVFIFLIFPGFLLTSSLILAGLSLYGVQKAVVQKDVTALKRQVDWGAAYWRFAEANLESTNYMFDISGQQDLYRELSQLVKTGKNFSQGAGYLIQASEKGKTVVNGILNQGTKTPLVSLTSSIKGDLSLADHELALVEAQLKNPTLMSLFERVGFVYFKADLAQAHALLPQLRAYVRHAQVLAEMVPEMVGNAGPRTYLIVFQNNMELRPTGGFIGSYALVTFENSVLQQVVIEDVYTADGQLKGHVDPPEPIRVYLEQEHWYMRDSNWDPDFSQSAARIAWFLEKELDLRVDGVVAVDLVYAQKLLQVTGPLELSDYQDTISAENLFLKTQQYVHHDNFPGSTQKKDFLGTLTRILTERLIHDETLDKEELFKKTYAAVSERHLLVFFTDQRLQTLAGELGGTGNQELPQCQSPCTSDYLMVVDANLGVNKVNYFVKRTISDQVVINEEEIVHNVRITYNNSSPAEEKTLGGRYKNYLRIYLHPDSTAVQAQLDQTPVLLEESLIASPSSMAVGGEDGFRVVSAILEVLPQTEKTVHLTVTRPVSIAPSQTIYVYKLQKQAGMSRESVSITLSYPPQWQVLSINQGPVAVAGIESLVNRSKITYNTSLPTDEILEVKFLK